MPQLVSVENVLKQSKCYGVAYDGTTKQCKQCEAAPSCLMRTNGKLKAPTLERDLEIINKAANKGKEPKRRLGKTEKKYDPYMPKKFGDTVDDMVALALDRGLTREQVDKILRITDERVRKMMMSKEIRKTYEIK